MKNPKLEAQSDDTEAATPTCGMIMPISAIDGCNEAHWSEVKEILSEAIESAGFEPQLVSDADDVGIIQKRIIQNIYENPIVVCDVSGKNPNVMFELGLRLAFDKPTIIVKDDKTSYSFDTAPIEHLEYPRDLRFTKIVNFKDGLTEKIQATYAKATTDKNYTTFLKHFGTFTVPKLDTQEISKDQFIVEELQSLRTMIGNSLIERRTSATIPTAVGNPAVKIRRILCLRECDPQKTEKVSEAIAKIENIGDVKAEITGNKHSHFKLLSCPVDVLEQALGTAKQIVPTARLI